MIELRFMPQKNLSRGQMRVYRAYMRLRGVDERIHIVKAIAFDLCVTTSYIYRVLQELGIKHQE